MALESPTNSWKKLSLKIVKFLTFQEKKTDQFILSGLDEVSPKQIIEKNEENGLKKEGFRPTKKPHRIQRTTGHIKEPESDNLNPENLLVDAKLHINREYIEKIYSLPINKDIIVRDFFIASEPPIKAFAVFLEGLADKTIINEDILKPLMIFSTLKKDTEHADLAEYIKTRVLYGNQVDITEKYKDILDKVNYGGTAVFIEGSPKCLLVETKGWDKRSVGKPETEQVIRGPHEAFNETLRSNTGLIRKGLRNENLITEMFKIGTKNKTDVALMYLKDLVNPNLIEEVRFRLTNIKTDYIGESGILEQFMEDHPYMPIPQFISTERPDRVVSFIVEGKVAILIDNSPNVLVAPVTFFTLLHSAEDYYLRFPYGNFIRYLRAIAVFLALVTPAVYVAITTFHQEMIPTDLILAISAARQTVPFPTIVEVFMMEFAFELIREAGVRVPGVVGNTLGIVGALILGQAAVQAGIVSPILIIIIAITGLASFAIPNYSMAFAVRGIRFIFTALAAVFGFFGISAGFFILLTLLTGIKSFGIPFLAPLGPKTGANPDIVFRGTTWSMEKLPDFMDTQERWRQPDVSRVWLKKERGRHEE